MDNQGFLAAIEHSFVEFVKCGTSRSTRKLVPLHGAIARDMHERLGDGYFIMSQGFSGNKEGTISGRYMDKKVDVAISKADKPVCGIAVKFVMQNYSQNSNNYFENMLGETANIRSARCKYFQIFIIPEKLPYYDKEGNFRHWEIFSDRNMHKYAVLDKDDTERFYHAPDKTLIYILKVPSPEAIATKKDYQAFYLDYFAAHGEAGFAEISSPAAFNNSVILNDYNLFAKKVYHAIESM